MSDRDMKRLIALLERKLGMAWKDVVEWLRGQNALDAIAARLEAGDYVGAVSDVDKAAARFASNLQESFVESGKRTAKWLDKKIDDKLVTFEETGSGAVAHARQNKLELIRGFTEEQRTITRNVLTDGLRRGANPREMARDLRDSIGLTETQEQHVRNYRRALESGQWSKAMGYELRDARADRTMRRLQRDGGNLTSAQIDALVARYRRNYIGHRATVIARTEALAAAHAGHDVALEQAIANGDVSVEDLEETWHAGPNTKHARDDHQAMDEVSVPFGTDFVLPDGTKMRGPGDRRGGAKHNAGCRCNKSTTYKQDAAVAAAA